MSSKWSPCSICKLNILIKCLINKLMICTGTKHDPK